LLCLHQGDFFIVHDLFAGTVKRWTGYDGSGGPDYSSATREPLQNQPGSWRFLFICSGLRLMTMTAVNELAEHNIVRPFSFLGWGEGEEVTPRDYIPFFGGIADSGEQAGSFDNGEIVCVGFCAPPPPPLKRYECPVASSSTGSSNFRLCPRC
jgi:hypothetical protein